MATACGIAKLEPLVEYLDGLSRRASLGSLRRLLTEIDLNLEDVTEFARFDEQQYLRNLVCDGPWYHVLVLCWRSGQRSPIHNHAQSTCGLKVLAGVATETVFEPTPSGLIKAVTSTDLVAGHVCATQDGDIHQVSNLQAPGTDLVTLHIYSPPLLRMQTFSLIDRQIGEYRPMVLEHAQGSGI